jgi:putative membrane protein
MLMLNLAYVLVALVAALHLYFLYLEMVAWDTPAGRKVFGTTPEFSKASKALAANQGLYNGFLAAGLAWGTFHPDPLMGRQVQLFFLACVAAAGIMGALTVSRRIFLIQSFPALIGLALGFAKR